MNITKLTEQLNEIDNMNDCTEFTNAHSAFLERAETCKYHLAALVWHYSTEAERANPEAYNTVLSEYWDEEVHSMWMEFWDGDIDGFGDAVEDCMKAKFKVYWTHKHMFL